MVKIGTAGGTGHAIEFGGQVFRDMSIEGRMTVCNMAIEGGARVGMVAVDEKTIEYVKDRPYAPKGEQWDASSRILEYLACLMKAHTLILWWYCKVKRLSHKCLGELLLRW